MNDASRRDEDAGKPVDAILLSEFATPDEYSSHDESGVTVEPISAELVGHSDVPARSEPGLRRRLRLPIILFLITCVSTFLVGSMRWYPGYYMGQAIDSARFGSLSMMPIRQVIVTHWDQGLIYMGCILAILLTHEMGHFVATLRHRIPASFPFFIPFPVNPFGTLGAVIAMDGKRADRKQIFDIGLAGPIAGLVVAIPILLIGIMQLDLTEKPSGGIAFENPLAVRLLLDWIHPPGYEAGERVWISQLNPFYMAGWLGLLITGLNMMPVSQLDGGHVVYTLFGRKWGRWVARCFLVAAIAYVVYAGAFIWWLMIAIVLLLGTDHPPTRDDRVQLGWFRVTLGLASLSIPILCFPPKGITIFTGF